jgi:nicotinamide mononucleotide adenylyltransferase
MEDLFTNMETFLVAQSALKDQLDLLKDIVIQIPDVQKNPEMRKDIARLFKQYSETH